MEKFLAIAVPEPTVLLGRELRPLSLGHLLYLERFGCLPVNDPDKLVMASLICSLKFEDILPTLQDRWLTWKIRWWHFRLGEPDWQAKYDLWNEYFLLHTRAPSVISKSETRDESHSGTPFYQHLKVTLQSRLNYTPSEALNCPFGVALFDYYSLHEIDGNVDVCDEKYRREMREQADQQHEELVRQVIDNQRKAEDGRA